MKHWPDSSTEVLVDVEDSPTGPRERIWWASRYVREVAAPAAIPEPDDRRAQEVEVKVTTNSGARPGGTWARASVLLHGTGVGVRHGAVAPSVGVDLTSSAEGRDVTADDALAALESLLATAVAEVRAARPEAGADAATAGDSAAGAAAAAPPAVDATPCVLRFARERIRAMLARPHLWGGQESVELQVLLLLEVLEVARDADPGLSHRTLSDRWDALVAEATGRRDPRSLAVVLRLQERTGEFSAMMTKLVDAVEADLGLPRLSPTID